MNNTNREPRAKVVPYIVAAIVATGVALTYLFWQQRSTPALPGVVDVSRVEAPVARAIDMARQQVIESPRDVDARARFGYVLTAHGLIKAGAQAFQSAQQLDPKNPRWPYLLGMLESDPEIALRQMEYAVELDGNEPTARMKLGELYFEVGEVDKAEEQFALVLQRNPNNARALAGMGSVTYAKGDYAQSLQYLEQSISLVDHIGASYILLAKVHHRLGNTAEAVAASSKHETLRHAKTWPDPYAMDIYRHEIGATALSRRVTALHRAGEFEAANRLLKQAISWHPDSAALHLKYGKIVLGEKKPEEAERLLRKAVELGADTADAYLLLATAVYSQRRIPEAITLGRQALMVSPDDGRAHIMLAMMLDHNNQRNLAIDSMIRGVSLAGNDLVATKRLAHWLTEAGRLEEAKVYADRTEELERAKHQTGQKDSTDSSAP